MTKFHFAGRYNDDPDTLICHPHEKNYVAFKEAETMNELSKIITIWSIIIVVITLGIYFVLSRKPMSFLGALLSVITLVPHEYLHAICFKGDVYMYENLKKGMLFVIGPGTFSKWEFVFMSMLPNIVFGFIPFIIFLFNPSYTVLGTLGALSIASGAGDYYNVFNALTQMRYNARTYMNGTRSYWYIPENQSDL